MLKILTSIMASALLVSTCDTDWATKDETMTEQPQRTTAEGLQSIGIAKQAATTVLTDLAQAVSGGNVVDGLNGFVRKYTPGKENMRRLINDLSVTDMYGMFLHDAEILMRQDDGMATLGRLFCQPVQPERIAKSLAMTNVNRLDGTGRESYRLLECYLHFLKAGGTNAELSMEDLETIQRALGVVDGTGGDFYIGIGDIRNGLEEVFPWIADGSWLSPAAVGPFWGITRDGAATVTRN